MEDRTGLVTVLDSRSHKQRMLDGDWFWGPDSELLADQARSAALVSEYVVALNESGFSAMTEVGRRLFGKFGDFTFVKPPFTIEYGYNTSLGPGAFVNSGAVFLDAAPINIGESVLIGPSVQMLTSYHPMEIEARRKQLTHARPITIGDDAWIGGGAVFLAGVTVGAGAMIGAGSVVTNDVPSYMLAVGNPARVVRELVGADDRPSV